eukprot:COSAG04_NODE_3328_length_2926_cov_21.296198_3_plen_142_part_00
MGEIRPKTRGGLLQAAGSWSVDACCAVHGNDCRTGGQGDPYCVDRTSSSDWLFGLWPGPPQRFEPTGTDTDYEYQSVYADHWPSWGYNHGYDDLAIGWDSGAPGGSHGECDQGCTYRGTDGEICGGGGNWGATAVEVWYPR